MKKVYYELRFSQRSPLRISSGGGEQTDVDVLRDSRGLPFLPGSAIAGVLRGVLPTEKAAQLFGALGAKMTESLIMVSDGTLPADTEVHLQHRDGVGIGERGTAIPGAKYDFETVECAAPYTAVLELADDVPETLETALDAALGVWVHRGAQFGARTTRGYGEMAVSVRKKTLESLSDWLTFDPFAPGAFEGETALEPCASADDRLQIRAKLRMKGSFTVRTAAAPPAEELDMEPKQEPLQNAAGLPVIPGTAWAGAFRHHMLELSADLKLDRQAVELLFGSAEGTVMRSRIRFGETAVTGSKSYLYTRSAVDRYTGAPRNQALFTERYAYGGTGTLEISVPRDTDRSLLELLAVSLVDLDLGLLSFGGEGGVGRGVCEIEELMLDGARDVTELLKAQDVSFLTEGGC